MFQVNPRKTVYDVCIIGSGAGGGTAAKVLTEGGLNVVMLEAGPRLDPDRDFKEHVWPYQLPHRGAGIGGLGSNFGEFLAPNGFWEIDGEPYWDGGYSGNPTITPLIRECKSQDTILVQINPVERESSPRSASEILNRLNEVSFNAVLLKELRMIALLRQVADPGSSEGAQWAGMRIHRIASEMLTELGASSKLNAEWEFFSLLRKFTADGFFTSEIGINYLGYIGNKYLMDFPGCPPVPEA